jgi:hypothetical protein
VVGVSLAPVWAKAGVAIAVDASSPKVIARKLLWVIDLPPEQCVGIATEQWRVVNGERCECAILWRLLA